MNSSLPRESELDQAVANYLICLRQAGLSPATVGKTSPLPLRQQSEKTLGKYGYRLRQMSIWLEEAGITQIELVTTTHLRTWAVLLIEAELAPSTVRTCLIAARGFFAWCVKEGMLELDPAQSLVLPRVKGRLQRTLSAQEIIKLCQACETDPNPDLGARNLAMISLAIDTGLRAAEICRLRLDQVFFDAYLPGISEPVNFLTVVIKGGREAPAIFSDLTAERLQAWLDIRDDVARTSTKYFFCSVGGLKPGTGLTVHGLRAVIRYLAVKAHIPHFSPHAMRRAFACLLVEAGAPERTIQDLGRWESSQMVATYTRAYRAAGQFAQYSPADFIARKSGDKS